MQSTATATRSARPASPPVPQRNFLTEVTAEGPRLPNRLILHGVEGIGKTSFAAQAPKPFFLMARGETGLETLIDNGRLAPTPHIPALTSWADTLGAVNSLISQPHDYRTVVADALGGFERLCHEQVCAMSFKNDWGENGFASYGKGPEVAVPVWLELLAALDRLRVERKMAVILIAHTKVKPFRNPEGADYDRYTVDCAKETWAVTHKWADMVLFANHFTETIKEKGEARAKGRGGELRLIYTERRPAWDAKNRSGLPPDIDMGSSSAEAWGNFMAAVREAREATVSTTTEPTPELAEVTA